MYNKKAGPHLRGLLPHYATHGMTTTPVLGVISKSTQLKSIFYTYSPVVVKKCPRGIAIASSHIRDIQ